MADETQLDLPEVLWTMLAGLAFAAAAKGFAVWHLEVDDDLTVAGMLAAVLVGSVSWFFADRYTSSHWSWPGLWAGMITGILTHPVTLFLWMVIGTTQENPIEVLVLGLGGALWLSLYSLPILGIYTIPIAIITGVSVATLKHITTCPWRSSVET